MIIKLELLRYFRFNFIFLLNFDFKSSEILLDLNKNVSILKVMGENLKLNSFPVLKKEKYIAIIAKRLKKGSNSNSITGLTWKVVGSLISLG